MAERAQTCGQSIQELMLDNQLCFSLFRNSRRFVGRWDRFLRRHNLTFGEYVVLLSVWERWPVSENALALRLQFDPETLEEALVQLERARWVTRSPHLGTGLHRVVEATQASLELRPKLLEMQKEFACESGLDAKLHGALMRNLDHLAEALGNEAELREPSAAG